MEEIRAVAVLGTGIMGGPIARNLLEAGFEVRVWDRTRERAEPLAEDGATVAGSPGDAVSGADAVLTMLTDGDAVEQVMSEAIRSMDSDAVWLQTSTIGVAATARLRELARANGVPYFDAPVLGTKQPAEEGTLLVLGSGPHELEERCRPVFEAIGTLPRWLGEAGTGSRVKLVLNAWLMTVTEGTAEALALAQGLGLDPQLVLDMLAGTALDVPYLQLKGKAMLAGELEPQFPLRLVIKDARLVIEAAGSAGVDIPFPAVILEQLRRAAELGHADEDVAAIYFASRPD